MKQTKRQYVKRVRACKNVGVEGVDLYGGTRHSTLTALGEFLSPEEVKRGSLHKTNKALERYLQGKARYAKKVSAQVLKMQEEKKGTSDKASGKEMTHQ